MKLKIATLNFWGLPLGLSKNKTERLKKLITTLKKENFDILCLQELWMNHDFNSIKKAFPTHYFHKRKGLIFNPSGLVVMSKFPLLDKKYTVFHRHKLTLRRIWRKLTKKESFFEKGLMQASIKVGSKILKINNLHLRYCVDFKLCQLQYRALIPMIQGQNNLIFGDFNINYPDLIVPKNFRLLSDPNFFTYRDDIPPHKKWTLDFIITDMPKSHCHPLKTQTDSKNILSDHYLVSSVIEV